MIEKKDLFNFGYITKKLPKSLYENLLDECNKAVIDNDIMISGLTGKGVPEHYYVNKNLND